MKNDTNNCTAHLMSNDRLPETLADNFSLLLYNILYRTQHRDIIVPCHIVIENNLWEKERETNFQIFTPEFKESGNVNLQEGYIKFVSMC